MDVSGIYIIVKSKEEALELFEKLKKRYGFLHGGYSPQQQYYLFKSYCHDVATAIKECFEFQMLGPNKCLKKISKLQSHDNASSVCSNTIVVYELTISLYSIVRDAVPLSEFPSCRRLAEMSIEDAVSVVNDLNSNHIVKGAVCAWLLGKKVSDIIKISDVEDFYIDRINQLENELREVGRAPIPMEEFLLKKFRGELAYCHKARIKAGLGIAKEVVSLIVNVDAAINDYESAKSTQLSHVDYTGK